MCLLLSGETRTGQASTPDPSALNVPRMGTLSFENVNVTRVVRLVPTVPSHVPASCQIGAVASCAAIAPARVDHMRPAQRARVNFMISVTRDGGALRATICTLVIPYASGWLER
jgi:hypothetical protein